ncbi:hypothetical protein [Legionella sp. CNM-4043-24]|uniref:hypothetical protein n=1 Tax=Legionella sp. CNM-4043-24 TaxID=3421646 RepID=UPI00403B1019
MAAGYEDILELLVAGLKNRSRATRDADGDITAVTIKIDCGSDPGQFSNLFSQAVATEKARLAAERAKAKSQQLEEMLSRTVSQLSPESIKLLGFCHFIDESPFPSQLLYVFAANPHINIRNIEAALDELINSGLIHKNDDSSLSLTPTYTHQVAAHHIQYTKAVGSYLIAMTTIFDDIKGNDAGISPERRSLLLRALRFIKKIQNDLPSYHEQGNSRTAIIILAHSISRWATFALAHEYYIDAKTMLEFAALVAERAEYKPFLSDELLERIQTGLKKAEQGILSSKQTVTSTALPEEPDDSYAASSDQGSRFSM